jgi:hypothetical protein
MNNNHVEIIAEQFEWTIDKLIQEGYSELDVLKALSLTMYEFTDSFEEIGEEEVDEEYG